MRKDFVKILRSHSLLAIAVLLLLGYGVWQFFGGVIPADQEAKASASHNLSGWAWSDMPNANDEVINPGGGNVGRGMGWISFNSTDCDANNDGQSDGSPTGCPNVGTPIPGYGVNVKSDDDMEGYAWSENLAGLNSGNNGWISFNSLDLGGCPSGPCVAHFNRTTGAVSGWAKALASADPQAGGWDGWIYLSGTADNGSPYGVSAFGCNWTGDAWGGDILGWIKFGTSGANNKPVIGSGDACVVGYTLLVDKSGAGSGTVNFNPPNSTSYYSLPHSEIYSSGTGIDLTAQADAGSVFAGWTGDADCSDGVVTMNADKTCTANFNVVAGPDFTLVNSGNIYATVLRERAGDSSETTITVTPYNGFSSSVSLSAIDVSPSLPAGSTFSFAPVNLTQSKYSSGSQFKVHIGPGLAASQLYAITIQGVDGGLTRTNIVYLNVQVKNPGWIEF